MAPSFVPTVLESYIPRMIQITQSLVENLRNTNANIIDPLSIVAAHVVAISLETSMGLQGKVDSSTQTDITELVINTAQYQLDRVMRVYAWNDYTLKLYNWFYGIEDPVESLIKYSELIIDARMAENSVNFSQKSRNQAFLDLMLTTLMSKESGKNDLDKLSLMSELVSTLETSYETSTTTTMWFLHNMACNPAIQQRLFEELSDFDEKNENMTIFQLNELTYLDLCVRENLRIHPPVANMVRMVDEDTPINGYIVPKNTLTVTSIYAIHHDEEIYPVPEKFDPSRFEQENFAKIPSGAYIPFGDGPRRCLGERLALMEMKIIFANIVKNFRIEPFELDKQVLFNLTTKPKNPIKLRFIVRK